MTLLSDVCDIPLLYATEHESDPMIHAKLFTPWTSWTWFVIEFDGSNLCFGLVEGFERELGYFSVQELASIRGPGGLKIERDLYFSPVRLSAINATDRSPGIEPRLPFKDRSR